MIAETCTPGEEYFKITVALPARSFLVIDLNWPPRALSQFLRSLNFEAIKVLQGYMVNTP